MSFCIALAVRDLRMTADEALQAATLGGARALRRDDIGRLRPGARADAVLLDAPVLRPPRLPARRAADRRDDRRRARGVGYPGGVNRDRFPGLADGWARFDAPAGAQPVDSVIEAMADFMRSGTMANQHGLFAAGERIDELMTEARAACRQVRGRGAARRGVRAEHDHAHARLQRRRGPHARAGRRDRLHAARPRRQRAPLDDRRRARRRDRALRRAGTRHAGAARRGRGGRAERAHALGGRDGRQQRDRSRAGARCDRGGGPRRGRARVRGRRARRPAPEARRRRARLRRASSARRTSGSARTSRSCGRDRSCSRSCGPTS